MMSAPTKLLRDAYRALREEAELANDQREAQRLAELEDRARMLDGINWTPRHA